MEVEASHNFAQAEEEVRFWFGVDLRASLSPMRVASFLYPSPPLSLFPLIPTYFILKPSSPLQILRSSSSGTSWGHLSSL